MKPALLLIAVASMAPAQEPGVYTWNFANGTASPNDTYTKGRGYGFDLGTKPVRITGGVASEKPFFFSVAVPEGNYRVTAILGDPNASCLTTIKAKSRPMIRNAETEAGRTRQVSFTANVSDGKLTLEFVGKHPCLDALEVRKAASRSMTTPGR